MKLLYVTKELPFGAAEAFIYAELSYHLNQGHDILIVPVQKGPLLHESGRSLLPRTLAQPLISMQIIGSFVVETLRAPLKVARALIRTLDPRHPTLMIRNMAVWMKGVWLARELRLRSVDHMHVHWIAVPATMGMIAAEISGVSFSITAHRYDIGQQNLVPAKFAAANFVRAIDGPGAAELTAQLPLNQAPPVLIRMGVHVPQTEVSLREGELQSLRGLIGARFVSKKGHGTLIEAVSIARRNGLDVQIDCYGDGPLQVAAEAQVAELGLKDAVRFKGVASHEVLQAHIASGMYDFAVLPSVTAPDGDKEGIPVFLMEAMAVGLPVIATPNGGIPELITDETGILVPEYDAKALASAMKKLASSGELRDRLGQAARRKVASEFSIVGCMQSLEARFCAALNAKSKS